MQRCKVCGSTEFFKESGFYFCQTCQTQNEDIREEILEIRVDPKVRLRRTRIKDSKSDRTESDVVGWTSWELYNFILIGLTNELIELGVTSDIKLTVLQLWATYLGKLEVAFTSTTRRCVPKLARRFNKRDAEIIYGKVKVQRKRRKRKKTGSSTTGSVITGFQSDCSSMRELNKTKRLMATADYKRYMESQGSSDGDTLSLQNQSLYSVRSSSLNSVSSTRSSKSRVKFSTHAKKEAEKVSKLSKKLPKGERAKYKKKHITVQYKSGPHLITPMRLWAILYLALRIHKQPIHLGDMLRYGREGHLSYYKLEHLLPPEVSLTKYDVNLLSQNMEITHKGMRRLVASMAKYLGLWELVCPDFFPLISRYCEELELPREILLYTERLIALSPPKMVFNKSKNCLPNYEGRAMAFIIVVLKLLFGLDGITECKISNVADKINRLASERRIPDTELFNFREWQRYIECRKAVLINLHLPTKLKYAPHVPRVNSLYIKFQQNINSKSEREEPEMTNYKHHLPRELANAMKQCIYNLREDNVPLKEADYFAPSLTPLRSYIQQLTDHPFHELPSVLRRNFFATKIGYITKPESLDQLAAQCNVDLTVIDTNLHFIEKMVPHYEPLKMPSVKELKEIVKIQQVTNGASRTRSENINDYLHKKIPCVINIDVEKEMHYDTVQKSVINSKDFQNDFGYDNVLPNGKLLIPTDSDSESDESEVDCKDLNDSNRKLLDPKFRRKYNLDLSQCEKDSVRCKDTANKTLERSSKPILVRNSKGQFIKSTDAPSDSEKVARPKISKKKQAKKKEQPKDKQEDIFLLEHDASDANSTRDEDFFNLSNISSLDDYAKDIDTKFHDISNTVREPVTLFRPFKDYWMYHCVFSRVKPKNYELFEKSLPVNFRWLLNECAQTVEMSSYDLYEEVCLIESHFTHILKPDSIKTANRYKPIDPKSKAFRNSIQSKW